MSPAGYAAAVLRDAPKPTDEQIRAIRRALTLAAKERATR